MNTSASSASHATPAPDAGQQARLAREAYDLALGFRDLPDADRYEYWLSIAARMGHRQAHTELAGLRAARNGLIAAVNSIDAMGVLADHLLGRDPQP